MSARVILVEAMPRRIDGSVVPVRLAGGGANRPYDYAGLSDWRGGIVGLPTLIASLEFAGGDFPPGSVPAAAELEWGGRGLADLAALVWHDAPISIRIGTEDMTMPPVALAGRVLEAVTTREQRLKISLSDPAAGLKKPLLKDRFAGTGGLEGPAEWAGRIKPRVWGRIWNLRAEPIDKANNIYCLADPARPILAIDAVRDKGAAAAALDVLAWQGTLAATLAALQAAVAPQGGGVICPSIACIKWWTQPAGDLCADLRGEVGAAYVETAAEIAERLIAENGSALLAAGTVAEAAAARPAQVGWLAADDSTTAAQMLDDLLGATSLMWLLNSAGEVVLRPWEWSASVASAISHDAIRLKTLRPVTTRKLGYKRNELKMQRGDLAAIVLAEGVQYADGTPIEDLKPAEPGADVTIMAVPRHDPTGGSATFSANYMGALDAGQLPFTIQIKRLAGMTDVSALATWTITSQGAISGGTVTVDDGVMTIPSGVSIPPSTDVLVTSDYDGLDITTKIAITRIDSAPPVTGGGGGGGATTVTDNTLNSVSNTTMVALSDVMTVRTGSSGTITFAGVLSIIATAASPEGFFGAQMRWKYRPVGGSFSDVGSVINETVEAEVFYDELGEPSIGRYFRNNGSISVAASQTGLSANTDYEVALFGARDSSTPTKTISFGGTVSATGG